MRDCDKSDDPLWRQFKGKAVMEGKTVAEALREAIKLWLETDKNKTQDK